MAPNRDRLRSAALPTHVLQPHGFVVAHPLPSRRDVASTASNIQSVRLPCLQTKSLHHDGAPFKVVQQQGTAWRSQKHHTSMPETKRLSLGHVSPRKRDGAVSFKAGISCIKWQWALCGHFTLRGKVFPSRMRRKLTRATGL